MIARRKSSKWLSDMTVTVRCFDIKHLPVIGPVKGQDTASQPVFIGRDGKYNGFATLSDIKKLCSSLRIELFYLPNFVLHLHFPS